MAIQLEVKTYMPRLKNFQLKPLLNGILKSHEPPTPVEAELSAPLQPEDNEIQSNLIISNSGPTGQQETLIETGPRLDIQTAIDLVNGYKNVPPQTKIININLNGVQTAHGAVIQALLVIQISCMASGRLFIVNGLSSELSAFFCLAGLKDLLVENKAVQSR